jgi:hypothetical protein
MDPQLAEQRRSVFRSRIRERGLSHLRRNEYRHLTNADTRTTSHQAKISIPRSVTSKPIYAIIPIVSPLLRFPWTLWPALSLHADDLLQHFHRFHKVALIP